MNSYDIMEQANLQVSRVSRGPLECKITRRVLMLIEAGIDPDEAERLVGSDEQELEQAA